MFFDPACIPCIIKQAHNGAKLFTNGNKELQLKIIKEVCKEVELFDDSFSASQFSITLQSIIEKNIGIKNPYKKIKEENAKRAEQYIPYLQSMVENADDKIEMALRVAIAGNIIDMAANPGFNILDEVNRITSDNIELSEIINFKEELKSARLILYIGDNFEEALFDKILLKQLSGKRVIFAVRSRSIFNDITLDDAHQLGIQELCEVIESGSIIAGTDLNQTTSQFSTIFEEADLIIAKGQGNYETLLNADKPIFFLFKVKCEVIANRCGFPLGKGVLLHYKPVVQPDIKNRSFIINDEDSNR